MKHQKRLHVSALIAIAATIAGAGCGGGSSSSGTNASSNALASAGGRRAAIAACLKKQGITPPQRPRGEGGRGLFGGGGRFENPQFRAALRKCGINPPTGRRFNGAMYRQAITKFAACVRQNGYNLPAPNLSGNGPVFDPSKVNRNDPKFMTAARKCQGLLRFRRPGPPPGAGASA